MSFANLFARFLRDTKRRDQAGATVKPAPQSCPMSGPASGDVRTRDVEDLLAEHRDVIARIKLCYGCDNATFNADLLDPIRRYASYVNALPATRAGYYCRPGGLLRLGLDVAFYALQATDSQIFAGRQTISNRRVLEPRWRRATFIAGLCSELHRCLGRTAVRDPQGQAWQPYLSPLTVWLKRQHAGGFRVQWLSGPERRALGLFALPMIVPAATLEDLAQGNDVIVPHMLASISGMATYHEHNVMDRLVRHAAALVINRELRAPGRDAPEEDLPVHLARDLVEAMRELVLSDANWLPNAPRSRLWYGQDGLYLVWPNGAADIIRLLADERLPGAPDTAQTALEILVAGGVVPESFRGRYVVSIQPPGAPEPLTALPIVPPSVLLADVVPAPAPLPCWLEVDADHVRAPPPPAGQQPDGPAPAESRPPNIRKRPAAAQEEGQEAPVQLPLPEMRSPDAHPSAPAKGKGAPRARAASHPPSALRTADTATEPSRDTALRAPLRLNRTVARALESIVGTLYAEKPLCHIVGDALFVPLRSLAGQGVDARQTCRSLADAGMLEQGGDGERVQSEVIDGQSVPGVRIAAVFVTGLKAPRVRDANDEGPGDVDA